jgi:chemotaxis protein histidine kinase CheA
MGKKSLTKSTTKKKAAPKKKTTAKKAAVKTAPKKKAAVKAQAAPKKTPAKKKAATKKPTLTSLLKKDFGSWAPENIFAVLPDEDYLNNFTAPPMIEEKDKTKTKALKTLLAKQFDLNTVEKPAKEKKAAPKKTNPAAKKKATPAKKKALSIPELLKVKFDTWQPEEMYVAKTDDEFQKGFTAPPAIEIADKDEADRIKALLATTFDMSVIETLCAEALEKAKAVKEAEEKAKAEAKAKAEKEAAEKAKAEAEAKAKAEKEAADKAKAVKEAEEKAKAEKAKAEEAKRKAEKTSKPPAPPVMPTVSAPTEPPMNSALKMLIALVGGFFGLLIIASAMNTNNYYLKSADNAVEIWQGKFSPTGEKLVMSVPGAVINEPIKSVYAKKEALVPAFDYYIGKAEALSKVRGVLDFDSIKSNLYKAIKFAPTMHYKKEAKTRLNQINFKFLVYKADVAAGKNTVEGCEAALKNLLKATPLGTDKAQKELLNIKTVKINKTIAVLKAKIKALQPAATTDKHAIDKRKRLN